MIKRKEYGMSERRSGHKEYVVIDGASKTKEVINLWRKKKQPQPERRAQRCQKRLKYTKISKIYVLNHKHIGTLGRT